MNSYFFHRLGQSFPRVRLKDTYYDRKKKKRRFLKSPAKLETVSDTLTFNQTITLGIARGRILSQTITFSETITESKVYNKSISDSLTLSQTIALNGVYNKSVSNTLTFTELAKGAYGETLDDTLIFVSTPSYHITRFPVVSDTLTFTQTISEAHAYARSVSNTFTFNETIVVVKVKTLHDTITFSQTVTYNAVHNKSISDSLSFTQVILSNFRTVQQSLIFNETITKQQIIHKTIADVLVFNETIKLNKTVSFHFNDTLLFLDPFYVPTQFNHLIFAHRAVEYVIPPRKCVVILESTQNNDTIVLPCPIFDDEEGNLSEIKSPKRTMRGSTYTYIKRSNAKKLKYVFTLDTLKAIELKSFLSFNQSLSIRMTNWKGEVWFVFITNNPVELVYKGRRSPRNEEVEVQLEFEGYKYL